MYMCISVEELERFRTPGRAESRGSDCACGYTGPLNLWCRECYGDPTPIGDAQAIAAIIWTVAMLWISG